MVHPGVFGNYRSGKTGFDHVVLPDHAHGLQIVHCIVDMFNTLDAACVYPIVSKCIINAKKEYTKRMLYRRLSREVPKCNVEL